MGSRPLIIATLLGASVGVPYLASQSKTGIHGSGTGVSGVPTSGSYTPLQGSAPSRLPITTSPPTVLPQLLGSPSYASAAAMSGPRFTSADQVLRFDVTKEWVYQNWDRKSTGPTDVGLYSVRVPLVMAPQMNALAGSLTYYFSAQGQVEHISFRGRTGDTTQLVQLLTSKYQLQLVDSPTGEKVYQLPYQGQVQSELRTRPEAILRSNSPYQSIAVELELARPGSERVLPPRPTGFQVPQVAGSPAPTVNATASEQSGGSAKSGGSFFDKFRHATPQEESQVLWKRWPN